MSIDAKDIKLLWGKAANRCSMPECRRPLVAPSTDLPATVIVGEMAHIIGEKNSAKSPRGISKMPVAERNRYTNLILLCAHHHTVIDKDEKNWPVETLHTLKRDHELWIEERLGEVVDTELLIYQDFIDGVAISLNLENWEWVCDCLFRQIMHVDFPRGIYQLDFELFRAILPGRLPEFEESLRNLVTRSRAYLDHYLSDAENAPGDPRIMNRKRYKDAYSAPREEQDRLVMEYRVWERNCTMMLFNVVRAINEFADVVRRDLRPTFFIRQGRFCVHDAMGIMSSTLSETWHLPQHYFPEEALASPLEDNTEEMEDR